MKFLVIGGSGSLGRELVDRLEELEMEVLCPYHEKLFVEVEDNVRDYISLFKPNWVINCAAYLNNLCEENPLRAYNINSIGALNVAKWSYYEGAKSIYISSNMVFDGESTRFYSSKDIPNPINIYGKSKYAGEIFSTINPLSYIIRTNGLFGKYPTRGKKMNFVEMVVNNVKSGKVMNVKNYEFTSPTYNTDLIQCMLDNIIFSESKPFIYHIVNEGIYTWFSYAEEIAKRLPEYDERLIRPMNENQTPPDNIQRPKCGLMLNSFMMPTVTNALDRYFKVKGF